MCDKPKIMEIMEQKRRLLRSVEDATQEMITCHSDKLEELMIRREKLVSQLKKADEELEELCADQEDGPAVLEAALCKGEPERLTGTAAEVYQAAGQHRAILSRLRESEMQVILRLKQEQLEILEKIKTANQGSAAKAARFFSTGRSQGSGFSRLGRA